MTIRPFIRKIQQFCTRIRWIALPMGAIVRWTWEHEMPGIKLRRPSPRGARPAGGWLVHSPVPPAILQKRAQKSLPERRAISKQRHRRQ